MKKKLVITVAGEAGSGKSTIASQLYNFLTISGFKVRYTNDDDPLAPVHEIAKRYINLVCSDVEIDIKTQQTAREASTSKESVNIESPLYKTLIEIICRNLGVEPNYIKPESDFITDLGADSLDTVELLLSVEDEFGISIEDEDSEKLKTVADAYYYLKEHTCR